MKKPRRRTRTDVSRMIYLSLVNFTTKRKKKVKLIKMAELAIENQVLLNKKHASFVYDGRWYASPPDRANNGRCRGLDKTLHHSLRGRADSIVNRDSFDINVIHHTVTDLLGVTVRCAECVDDLKKILPIDMITSLELTEEDLLLFNTDKEQVQSITDEILIQHAEGIQVLKQLYMLDLLMAKVI